MRSSNLHEPPAPKAPAQRKARWVKRLHQWHWISSAICLVGMILFSLSGITLNHAGAIEARPTVTRLTNTLPMQMQEQLLNLDVTGQAALPSLVVHWLEQSFPIHLNAQTQADWSEEEIYLALPRPGGDAWLKIERSDGAVEYERTDRGWIAWLNDLHKGRHTGIAWSWFIDIFALASLIFAISGLLLLKLHAANRGMTWPLVAGGLLLPALLIFLFVH
jgi:uncharacterized protein